MAPLTWRNVDDPDLGKASRILDSAVNNWDRGLTNISDTLGTVRDNQRRNRSAAAIPVLAGINSGGDVDRILAQVTGMVDPRDMTPELQQAVLNARGTGLGYDQTRTATDATRSSTARANETHSRQIAREDQEASMADEIIGAYQNTLWGNQGGGAGDAGPPLNDRELLARTIEAEAGGEGYDGMLAAGSVIANRAAASNGNLRGVILAPGQFSAWNSLTGYAGGQGGLDMNAMRPSEEAYRVADAIQSGDYQDPTGGATHYYNPNAADPDWGARAGGQWRQIGNHVFGTAAGGVPAPPGGGIPERQPVDISGMIPEGNRLGVDFYLDLANQMYGAQDRAITDRRGDIGYAQTQTDAAEQEAQKAQADQLREQGWNYARNLGPDGREEAQNYVMGLGLPPDQTRLMLEGVNSAFDTAPAYFEPSDSVTTSPEAQAAMAQLEMNAGIADDKNPVLIGLEALGLSSADQLATDEAVSGSGVAQDVKQQGVTSVVEDLMSRAEQLDLREEAPDIISTVNKIAEALNIDPRIVARLVEPSLSAGFWGGTVIDEARLRSLVEPLADPEERRRLIGIENAQAGRREELTAAIDAQRDAAERIDVYGRRPGEDAAARLREAQEDKTEADRLIAEIMARDNSAYGIGYDAPDSPSTEDLVAASSEERREMIARGEAVATPGGRRVDPNASGWDQMWSRMGRNGEISGALEQIRVGLATGGGAPANRFFGAISDFFQPAPQAGANQDRRETMRQALEWFQSEDAEVLFFSNPALLEEARRDPVGFWQRMQEQNERR
ncbi:MAG: cell wall hydrolase [Gemmobacter sp.]